MNSKRLCTYFTKWALFVIGFVSDLSKVSVCVCVPSDVCVHKLHTGVINQPRTRSTKQMLLRHV